MILTRIYGYTCLVLFVACVTLYGLWQHADGELARAQADRAEALVDAHKAVREVERRHALALAEIADKYEQDKRDAEAAQERLVSDLRAGTVRLRQEWRGCEAGAAATASQLDAEARAREALAAEIVRVGRDADDWIKRLQEIVRQDRAE